MGCRIFAALTLWILGHPDQALHWSHEALTLARTLSHPFSLTYALTRAARLHGFRGEWQASQERAEALIALARAQGFAQALATGHIQWGCTLAAQGQGQEGITYIRWGLDASRATGAELMRPFFLTLLAEACGSEGQPEEGLRVLAEAVSAVPAIGERWYEPERYRLKGELLLALAAEHDTEAQSCFRQALAIARRQQAKSWELRAAMSLSRLWRQQGKRGEARELLAPIYGWFTEGFDTADLQEAKVLLEALA
jgi:predicted ATPase